MSADTEPIPLRLAVPGEERSSPDSISGWNENSVSQLNEIYGVGGIPHRLDFRNGFGLDTTEESSCFQRLCKLFRELRAFQENMGSTAEDSSVHPTDGDTPPIVQPVTIFGAEQEGKTRALLGVTRAALDQENRVPSSMIEHPQIFVCESRIQEVGRAHDFVTSNLQNGRLTVCLVEDFERFVLCKGRDTVRVADDMVSGQLEATANDIENYKQEFRR
eukprot:CAMPEP_0177617580 /NCGR_PEP_ID=MMETSP0419_2-20121207/24996_1 /TAXON_ID=582737 /ORGANISM="Tetraselmis sp., Strain GSL018" /LENGTH=217 /DNA_ID=CAMNT_0019116177 /DNA_START=69 /DNA_END=719 /DNA_ORIENTATION=+